MKNVKELNPEMYERAQEIVRAVFETSDLQGKLGSLIADYYNTHSKTNELTTERIVENMLFEYYKNKYNNESPEWKYAFMEDSLALEQVLKEQGIELDLDNLNNVFVMFGNYIRERLGKRPFFHNIESNDNCEFVEGKGSLKVFYLTDSKEGLRVTQKVIYGGEMLFSVLEGSAIKGSLRTYFTIRRKEEKPLVQEIIVDFLADNAKILAEKFKDMPSPAETTVEKLMAEDGWEVWHSGGGIMIGDIELENKEGEKIFVRMGTEMVFVVENLDNPDKFVTRKEYFDDHDEYWGREGDLTVSIVSLNENNGYSLDNDTVFSKETNEFLLKSITKFSDFEEPLYFY